MATNPVRGWLLRRRATATRHYGVRGLILADVTTWPQLPDARDPRLRFLVRSQNREVFETGTVISAVVERSVRQQTRGSPAPGSLCRLAGGSRTEPATPSLPKRNAILLGCGLNFGEGHGQSLAKRQGQT